MLRQFRFVVAGIAIILANLAASSAVSASMTQAALPVGTTRYAVASATTTVLNGSKSFKDMAGLVTSISIPAGKHGDVMVTFCASVFSGLGVYAQVLVGGLVATPGPMPFPANDLSYCLSFYKVGIAAGIQSVRVQWRVGPGIGSASASARDMIVTVNIR